MPAGPEVLRREGVAKEAARLLQTTALGSEAKGRLTGFCGRPAPWPSGRFARRPAAARPRRRPPR